MPNRRDTPGRRAARGLRLILLGPPGAGKGTQAARVAERFGISHISTGELFRDHIARRTPIGERIRAVVERGDLVPDDVVLEVLVDPVRDAGRSGGWVIDGFPRTVEQARLGFRVAREQDMTVDLVVALEVPEDELVRRLLARGAEQGRADDREQTIRHRLAVHGAEAAPVIDHYRRRGVLVTVDAGRPPDEVTASLVAAIEAQAADAGA